GQFPEHVDGDGGGDGVDSDQQGGFTLGGGHLGDNCATVGAVGRVGGEEPELSVVVAAGQQLAGHHVQSGGLAGGPQLLDGGPPGASHQGDPGGGHGERLRPVGGVPRELG